MQWYSLHPCPFHHKHSRFASFSSLRLEKSSVCPVRFPFGCLSKRLPNHSNFLANCQCEPRYNRQPAPPSGWPNFLRALADSVICAVTLVAQIGFRNGNKPAARNHGVRLWPHPGAAAHEPLIFTGYVLVYLRLAGSFTILFRVS